jgi:hypothetical protein
VRQCEVWESIDWEVLMAAGGTGQAPNGQAPKEIQELMSQAQELGEKIGKIDPNLVVELSGPKNAPAKVHQGATPFDFTVTFNDFTNEPHNFTSAFAKAGDGFVNIHTLE